jgi:glycosyltransferase involved in cell wall biosynthesis
LEAAACAKPVIATNVPGCKNIVFEGVNGFLCNAKDANDLAYKMKKMCLLSDDELQRLGNKGRELVVNKFDENLVINKYLQEINALFPEKHLPLIQQTLAQSKIAV